MVDESSSGAPVVAAHIRPKKRTPAAGNKKAAAAAASTSTDTTNPPPDEGAMEETRQRIETWVGLKSNSNKNYSNKEEEKKIVAVTNALSTTNISPSSAGDHAAPSSISVRRQSTSKEHQPAPQLQHKSILKHTSKYSGKKVASVAPNNSSSETATSSSDVLPAPVMVVRDVVVERQRPARRRKKSATNKQQAAAAAVSPGIQKSPNTITRHVVANTASSNSVEGYTPKTTSSQKPNKNLANKESVSKTTTRIKCHSTTTTTPKERDQATGETKTNDNYYEPPTTSDDDGSDSEPLVFSSLSQLMETAGTLPKQEQDQETTPPQVYEAGLEFSCVAADEYKEIQEEAVQEQYDVFLGTTNPLQDDGNSSSDDDDDDDDEIWDLLGNDGGDADDDQYYSDEEEDEPDQPSEYRAFLKLWNAISQWVTPEAVAFVRHLRSNKNNENINQAGFVVPQVDRSDVGASRCAGLMAMLQMHTRQCLVEDLKRAPDDLRSAERLLASLLRCFNYDRPMPHLDSALARALTCILLATVVLDNDDDTEDVTLPDSCKLVEMNPDEYRYLSRSAIVNFGGVENSSK